MKACLITVLCILGSLCTFAEGVKIDILSPVSGLIRIESQDKYVLLPVEDNAPESDVRVLVNGKTQTTVQVRLAQHHVDYFVPMEVAKYDGKVVLYVHTRGDRATLRNAQDAAWCKQTHTASTFDTTNREQYRPAYHHSPLYGWMNDPNGQFYKDGVWHLYYQWNPYGSTWGNMTWGHATSSDMLHWEEQPAAVWADGLGTVFSGSCVVDKANTAGFGENAVVGFYTSAAENQIQSLIYSTDNGQTFAHYADNPVISDKVECRDPNLYWNEQTKAWNLYLVSPLTHEVWFYTSPNLIHWEKVSAFGGHGCLNGVWECPDLMRLPVRGTKDYKWLIILNINPGFPYGGSGTQYFIGDWDGKTFTCESAPQITKWMDYGKDHYATVSWSETNKVIAWMNNWQYANVVPTRQFRSANSLPRELDLFVGDDGETYVGVHPAEECNALRGTQFIPDNEKTFYATQHHTSYALPQSGLCEIVLDAAMASAKQLTITLSNDKGEQVEMVYDTEALTFAMDRRKSGLVDFSEDFPVVTTAPLLQARPMRKKASLRLFIDRCSIEVFEGEGRFAMTNLVFPTTPYTSISISANGKAKTSLQVYEIQY